LVLFDGETSAFELHRKYLFAVGIYVGRLMSVERFLGGRK